MQVRYTQKIAWLLFILSIITPWMIVIQYFPFGRMYLRVMGSFWHYSMLDESSFLTIYFDGLLYLLFWGPGLYIAKIAFDQVREQKSNRFEYLKKVASVWIIQFLLILFFGLAVPIALHIPVPIVGLIAILLRRFTVRDVIVPCESEITGVGSAATEFHA
ncbi:hypothetical protein EU527_01210 [Candidatus Thorarchaeota archaeon]|nr:MAG: hypothetical protein EU527_01210 [Candidatus Thorarchaeota archaeon]